MNDLRKNQEKIDQYLQELDVHAPSMRFTKGVVEKVKLETKLIKEDKNVLNWIPKLCIAGFAVLIFVFVGLIAQLNPAIDFDFSNPLIQILNPIMMIFGGVLGLLGLDRMMRWLMFSI